MDSRYNSYAPANGGLWMTRCVGEEIIIGEGDNEAVIVIESAAGGRVQLRVVAGANVPIVRAELRWSVRKGEGNV